MSIIVGEDAPEKLSKGLLLLRAGLTKATLTQKLCIHPNLAAEELSTPCVLQNQNSEFLVLIISSTVAIDSWRYHYYSIDKIHRIQGY